MKKVILIKGIAAVFAAGLFLAGCKKQESTQMLKSSSATDTTMVITPFGPRHRADLHMIPNGHQLIKVNGHLEEVETTSGKLINDFGVQNPLSYLSPEPGPASKLKIDNLSKTKVKTDEGIPPFQISAQWKTWAQSTQTKQGTFASLPAPQTFSTSWTVPSLPTTPADGQTIYIYNALEDDNGYSILQPVLQFGNAYTGGTSSWQISNYYIPCGNCKIYFSTPVNVNPGDAIIGQMQNSGSTGSLNWTSTMYKNGVAVATLPVGAYVDYPLTTMYETIESVNVTKSSDYPSDSYIAMHPSAGAGNPVENFTPYINSSATLGEHTVVPGGLGEVDLYFHPSSPLTNNIAEIDITNANIVYYWTKSGTVSAGSTTNSTSNMSPTAYSLAAGETPANIVGIAIANTGWVYYWYNDGTMSVGTATNATAYIAPKTYALPSGETPANILSISIAKSNNYVYTWYKDGTASIGNSTSLAAYRTPYSFTVATGKTISEVVGIGIEGGDDHCFAWYNDGTNKTVSSGISNQLDYYFAPQPASF